MLSSTNSRRILKVFLMIIMFSLETSFCTTLGNELSTPTDSIFSTNEVFLLTRNLHYIYDYKYEEKVIDMLFPISGRIDSGMVEYIILDSSLSSDTTAIWSVRQITTMWHIVWYFNQDTTIELTIDTLVISLNEKKYGNHQLWISGIVWDFPLYDPVQPIYRFSDTPSLIITRNWSEPFSYGNDTLKMSVTDGFFYRSLSARFGSIQNGTLYQLKVNLLQTPVVDVEINHDVLEKFFLYQNYPNPFNPSTTISWQTPISGWQTIKLYNALGQEVDTIVDEYLQAGFHSKLYIVNSTLPSGIYFYRLQAGDYVETKKMILLK